MLGVASLVVVLSVTSGFEREFQEKVQSVNAHLIVTSYGLERDVEEAEREAEKVRADMAGFSRPGAHVALQLHGRGSDDRKDWGQPQGRGSFRGRARAAASPGRRFSRRPQPAGHVSRRRSFRGRHGRASHSRPGSSPPGARRGRGLHPGIGAIFRRLRVHAERVRLPGRRHLVLRLSRVRRPSAFIPLEDAKRLGNARQSIFGVEMRFTDPMVALRVEEEVEARLGPDRRIIDWKTLNKNLFMALAMQKIIISLLLVLITVVAAFNILASLTLVVLSKVREVAILAAMGARRDRCFDCSSSRAASWDSWEPDLASSMGSPCAGWPRFTGTPWIPRCI